MDKLLSIAAAIVMVLYVLALTWLFSNGLLLYEPGPKSLTAGLRGLGGALGFWGGVLFVVATGLGIYGLHEIVNYQTGRAIVLYCLKRGHAPEVLAAKIDAWPLSRGLRNRLKALLKPAAK
jgi:hypothetical protein